MRVRIKGIEIYVESLDELDELIERYGSELAEESPGSGQPVRHRNSNSGLDNRDRAVLERFLEAGNVGVTTDVLGKILGKRGRGTRSAARRWAVRVGLVTDDTVDPFEECRIGTQRALRIEAAHMSVAKGLR